MNKRAVFIDRDGTVNEEMGYINHLSRFIILPGTAEAIRLLNEHGILAIIISNQSGVARGYFPISLVERVHGRLIEELEKKNAHIDGFFFCPHYPKGSVPEYSIECNCRKPKTGLIDKACHALSIDRSKSYVIGDRSTDIELATRCGMRGILVTTGYGLGEIDHVFPHIPFQPTYIAKDLLHGVRWIVKK